MQTQPITSQLNFNGNIRCVNCTAIKDGVIKKSENTINNKIIDLPSSTWDRMKKMIEKEPFDIFIHPNPKNEEFFNVDAAMSFDEVLKGIQGKVKVKFDALGALPLAIQDAIRNFEANIKEKKI